MPLNTSQASRSGLFGNVTVLPWYTARDLFVAGGAGVACLWSAILVTVLWGLGSLPLSLCLPLAGVCLLLFALCFLLGIRSVCSTAPQACRKAAFFSFLRKSILFLPAWIVCGISCVFIVGVFCNARRLGLAVSSTPEDCYTAFPDGRKVQVTRIHDTANPLRPLYRDAAGNLYRPPLRFKSTTHSP